MRPLWGGSRKVFAYVKALEPFQVQGAEQGVRVRRNTAFGLVLPPGWLLARTASPWGSASRIAPRFTLGTFLPLANKEAKTERKITRLLHPEKVLMHENCPSALMFHKRSPCEVMHARGHSEPCSSGTRPPLGSLHSSDSRVMTGGS